MRAYCFRQTEMRKACTTHNIVCSMFVVQNLPPQLLCTGTIFRPEKSLRGTSHVFQINCCRSALTLQRVYLNILHPQLMRHEYHPIRRTSPAPSRAQRTSNEGTNVVRGVLKQHRRLQKQRPALVGTVNEQQTTIIATRPVRFA